PGNGPGQACGGGGELAGVDDFTGGSKDRQDVIAGVGIDTDDERVSMRDDGHSGFGPPCSGLMVRPLLAGAHLGMRHFLAALCCGTPRRADSLLIRSPRWARTAPAPPPWPDRSLAEHPKGAERVSSHDQGRDDRRQPCQPVPDQPPERLTACLLIASPYQH